MQKIKNNSILILSVLFLFATVSAKYSFMIETMFSSLLKYGLAVLIICFTFMTAIQTENENKLLGKSIQLEWIFLFVYGILFVLQNQFFSSTEKLAFGISMGVANGMQKLAALFIGCYILKSGNKNFCRVIVLTFLIIILMDAITTMQAVSINDQALRLATMEDAQGNMSEVEELGVANVMNIFSYIACIPILFMLLINQKGFVKKLILIAVLGILVVSVVNAGFTMAIIIMMITLFILCVNAMSAKSGVKIMIVIVTLFLILCIDWAKVVLWLGSNVDNLTVRERFEDIYYFLEYGSQGDAMNSRTSRYMIGLEGFLHSPIIGNVIIGTKQTSGHSTIIDIMSNWGLIGIFLYISYLFYMFKASAYFILKKNRFYAVLIAIIMFVSFTVNPIGGYVHSIAVVSVFLAATGKLIYINEQEKTSEVTEIVQEEQGLKSSCIR